MPLLSVCLSALNLSLSLSQQNFNHSDYRQVEGTPFCNELFTYVFIDFSQKEHMIVSIILKKEHTI